MPSRLLAAMLLALALSLAGLAPATAQSTDDAAIPTRTEWGDPNLEGVWNFATIIPFQRPASAEGRAILTDEEAAEFRERSLERQNADNRNDNAAVDIERAYNDFWWDYGDEIRGNRSSLVIDPPDGKLPAITPEGRERMRSLGASFGPGRSDSWLDRSLWERCILGFNSGPPMIPSAYNNNMQLFQNADHVVILNEMVHSARVIPLDTQPPLSDDIRQWQGSSRGHWEGDTLVVETRNFRNEARTPYFRDSGEGLNLIERFTRADAETLLYAFTVIDPATYERYWTAEIPMKTGDGPIFEYACHEGNYGMFNLLSGARALEAAEAEEETHTETSGSSTK